MLRCGYGMVFKKIEEMRDPMVNVDLTIQIVQSARTQRNDE